MNWEQVESEWPRARQIFRERWGKLSDNDLYVIAGNRDRLCGLLQQRYGQTRATIEEFVYDFERRFDKVYSPPAPQPPAPAPRGTSEAVEAAMTEALAVTKEARREALMLDVPSVDRSMLLRGATPNPDNLASYNIAVDAAQRVNGGPVGARTLPLIWAAVDATRTALLAELAGKAGEEIEGLFVEFEAADWAVDKLILHGSTVDNEPPSDTYEAECDARYEDARVAILAHVAHLAAQRDEAVRLHADLAHEVEKMAAKMFGYPIPLPDCSNGPCEECIRAYGRAVAAQAHAAGYAAAREEDCKAVCMDCRDGYPAEHHPEWANGRGKDAWWHQLPDFRRQCGAGRLRALPSPAAPEPGTPKERA